MTRYSVYFDEVLTCVVHVDAPDPLTAVKVAERRRDMQVDESRIEVLDASGETVHYE